MIPAPPDLPESPDPANAPAERPAQEAAGPLARARRLAAGMADRVTSHSGLALAEEGEARLLSHEGRLVAVLAAMEGHVRVDVDPRGGVGNPAALRSLGSPHPDAARSAAGWRRVLVRTQADAARVVNALRAPLTKSTGQAAGPRRKWAPEGDAVLVGRIRVRRLEDPPQDADGARVLVDAEWPKDMPRDAVPLLAWMPEAAPSPLVRRAYGPVPSRDAKFRRAYLAELRGSSKAEAVSRLRHLARAGPLTLLTAVRDVAHSAAWVLARAVSQPRTPTV